VTIKNILNNNKIIAVVGFSDNPQRPSNRIARYLKGNGYKVFGVNPRLAGKTVDEIKCYAALRDLPEKADIVNVFRRSDFVADLINEIAELDYKPKVIWTQIGVIDGDSKSKAVKMGYEYVENKCIMVEHQNII